jgi:thiamine biosynthesis protein ThiI
MSSVPTLAHPELVLVRYGELALKGGNRGEFERALARNIRNATSSISPVEIERFSGRLSVRPEKRVMDVARRTQDVFGISSVSPAWGAPSQPEAIAEVAREVLADALADHATDRPVRVRVSTTRAEKRFPLTSPELDRYVATRILPGPDRVRVDLEEPELVLGIDVRTEKSYVFSKRLPGPGGLPVGTQGSALCLLSGGLDSPVAAWMTMKRGCRVGFVSFHSHPYLGEGSKKKVLDLAHALCRWQGRSRLYVVPFARVQERIRDLAPESYRTVLYRRMMQRIASRIAARDGFEALVTGESVGQVASQTLENMALIGAAAELLVLRPLGGFDKEETIQIARRIGTFDLSNVPEPDCCTVFQPSRPVIRGRLDVCLETEAALGVDDLVESALASTESVKVEYPL